MRPNQIVKERKEGERGARQPLKASQKDGQSCRLVILGVGYRALIITRAKVLGGEQWL
jgi:hypothetical protein